MERLGEQGGNAWASLNQGDELTDDQMVDLGRLVKARESADTAAPRPRGLRRLAARVFSRGTTQPSDAAYKKIAAEHIKQLNLGEALHITNSTDQGDLRGVEQENLIPENRLLARDSLTASIIKAKVELAEESVTTREAITKLIDVREYGNATLISPDNMDLLIGKLREAATDQGTTIDETKEFRALANNRTDLGMQAGKVLRKGGSGVRRELGIEKGKPVTQEQTQDYIDSLVTEFLKGPITHTTCRELINNFYELY